MVYFFMEITVLSFIYFFFFLTSNIYHYYRLDVYIYDYLMKRNLQNTAKAFLSEGNVATDPVGNNPFWTFL